MAGDEVEQGAGFGVGQVAPAFGERQHFFEQAAGFRALRLRGARGVGDLRFGLRLDFVVVELGFLIVVHGEKRQIRRGRFVGRGFRVGRGGRALGITAQGAVEGFDAGKQPLLKANQGDPATLAGRLHERGVARELLGQLDFKRFGRAQLAPLGLRQRVDGFRHPGAVLLVKVDPHHVAARELAATEGDQVAFEPAHHHPVALLRPHRHAAVEALRVEQFEQGREAVRVAVVRGGGKEEAILEARRHVANHLGDARVDRVAAGGGRRGHVGLVENQEAFASPFAEVLQQGVAVFGPAQQLVGNHETGVSAQGLTAKPRS